MVSGSAYFEGLTGTSGFSISPRRLIRRCHWSGFSSAVNLRFGAAFDRVVADVDVVVVVGQREAGFPGQVLERDHLVRVHRPLQLQDVLDQFVGHRPRALVAGHRRRR